MISVIIPICNREQSRINRCISYVRKNGKGVVGEIIVVDYGSKVPVTHKHAKVIRVEANLWNKANALNIGILKSKGDFIMTLDVDMLVDSQHFSEIFTNHEQNNFIISTNVRRIKSKDISRDYKEMIEKSVGWHSNSRNQYFNQANGGFQVYPRTFFDKIGGIMEGMGKFHRAVDNWVFYMARMNGLTTVDISYPLLHVEHKKQKEQHYDKKLRGEAEQYAMYKAWYIDYMINRGQSKNTDSFYGKEKPCEDLYNRFLNEIQNRDKKIQEAISSGKDNFTIAGQRFEIERKPSVAICVINNSGLIPDFFVWDLINLFSYTRQYFDCDVTQINACSIEQMRNHSIKYALGMNSGKKRYDYVVALDDDHRYPPHFIVGFIQKMQKNNWPILTTLTTGKKYYPGEKQEFKNTQYFKIQDNMNEEGNTVTGKKKQILEIESSGPVGMVIDTKIFNKLTFPYYSTKYYKVEVDGKEVDAQMGGDLHFCEALKKAGIPIRVDTSVKPPHFKLFPLVDGKVVLQ
jgi:glycosyltransferase involved in cell wall biosynthesis